MAFTTITELTLHEETGSIENGKGFLFEGNSFFYAADIKKVLEQAKNAPEAKLSQLCIINVKFEKNDDEKNHNRHDVTGLALAKSELQYDGENKIINTDWYEVVALAWPPYYIKGSVQTLEDNEPDSAFRGFLFEGSDEYVPGLQPLKRS
ncbi:MAG: hypothetical protein KDD19_19295 [Phaeodactylibacter sp.]|nr:hypothetical protein [Phaeodactylibacter sp.]MCB9051133.1 hypothetical protein [Lewinellaceae bacterium]